MNIVDIVIFLATMALVYAMINHKKLNKRKSSRSNRHGRSKRDKYKLNDIEDFITDVTTQGDMDDVIELGDDKLYSEERSDFVSDQFHDDYRDVITSMTKLTPQKEYFNQSEKPTTKMELGQKKILKLVKNFLDEINDTSRNLPPINKDDTWASMMTLENDQDGWEKQMKKLGLPPGIYNKPAGYSKLELIKIKGFEGEETEDEMRVICLILCQKKGVNDQILLKVNFHFDKSNVNDTRDFFKDKNNDFSIILGDNENNEENLPVVIEKIFVMGFFINRTINKTNARDNFYNFDDLIDENGLSDPKKVVAAVAEKRKRRLNHANTSITDPVNGNINGDYGHYVDDYHTTNY